MTSTHDCLLATGGFWAGASHSPDLHRPVLPAADPVLLLYPVFLPIDPQPGLPGAAAAAVSQATARQRQAEAAGACIGGRDTRKGHEWNGGSMYHIAEAQSLLAHLQLKGGCLLPASVTFWG